jgi:hypothetical protein
MKTHFNWRVIHRLAIALAVLLLLAAPALVQAQFTYTTNADGTLTLTGYTGTGGNITFPTNINGMTVSGLGSYVLLFNTNVTSITIPGDITNIAMLAIYMSQGITNATLGYGITSIPTNMFVSCGNLASVTIPESVTSIGRWAFSGCGLTQVTVPSGVTSIEGVFEDCFALTNVSLPPGITNIDDAFSSCSSLTTTLIPSTITSIAPDTFSYCTSLTNVLIPSNVTSIESRAFYGCTSLGTVTIPAGVTNIADGSGNFDQDGAFRGCSRLTNITILGSPNIGTYAFYELPLTSISIAGGVVGASAFEGCESLTNVTLGNGVTALGENAFLGDPIFSVFIPPSVTYIGNGTFEGYDLTNVVIGAGVDVMADYAFYGNTHLTNVLFLGNAPAIIEGGDFGPFGGCPATVYYLPGTTGWSNTFGLSLWGMNGAPTALWKPVIQTGDGHFGVSNGVFGFNITNGSTTNLPIAVMACTNLANPVWTSLTNLMLTNTYYFTDPQWSNYPGRYYGIGFP